MLSIGQLKMSVAGRVLFENASLQVNYGDRVALVGPNGAGKSTLFSIILGRRTPDEGSVERDPWTMVGYLPQEGEAVGEETVLEVATGRAGELPRLEKRLKELEAAGSVDSPEYMETHAKFDALNDPQVEAKAKKMLKGLGYKETDFGRFAKEMSGGWVMRAHLARLLVMEPDLLLLDEPTNHLDAESVDWLEQFLSRFSGTVVAITHDRYFLDNAAEWILELDRGHGIPYKGNYSSWLEQKEARLEQEQRTEDARSKAMKKELEWARQNPKGRQAKSKARLARFEELSDYDYQKRNETQEIFIPVAERLGNEVFEFTNVSKSFGDRLLIDNLSFKVPAGAIVGIIGPNGAGKSTLFKLIAGKEQPDSGAIKVGQTVKMAFVDQNRDDLSNDKTVWEDVSGGLDIMTVGKFQMPSRAYCGRFNFNGGDQQKKVGMLSGGERGRLHLAKTLIEGGNVLLLDEPSNDLDVETLRALEDALLEFAGSVMVISHDRWFLDRIATHILAAEGDSQWVFFDGNYQEYEADKKKRLGEEGAKPKRVRFKALK